MQDNKDYLDKIHRINYNMLCEVDRVCHKYRLRYYLHGGTMLGMARHKDFIPWDDDVDISMPRDDYEVFKKVFGKAFSERYQFLDYYGYDKFFDFIPRVVDTQYFVSNIKADDLYYNQRYSHPCIDIFVYDNVSKIYKLQLLFLHLIYALAMGHRMSVDIEKYKGIRKIGAYFLPRIGRHIPMRVLSKWYDSVSKWGSDSSDSWFVSNEQANHSSWGLKYKKKWYSSTKLGEIGKGVFPCPTLYTKELKMIFGDYMKLPPVQLRIPEHFSVYKQPMK